MSHLNDIYAVWDHNAEAMAADIEQPGVKVRQWRNRGNIPSEYWPAIIAAAARKGETLDWRQFLAAEVSEPVNITVYRIVVCDICSERVDGETTNACTFVDCPHTERVSELVSPTAGVERPQRKAA